MNSNQTFPRLCRVLEIYEADFGCEERPDGQETMVCVRLLDTTENANLSEHPEYTIRTADQAPMMPESMRAIASGLTRNPGRLRKRLNHTKI
ncbi:MAG: hypothetical protein ACLS5Z_07965 [Clostridium fessum]